MKKGMAGLKMIVGIILLIAFLFVVISIFLNKNFFDDALDNINNLFEPPEIDPINAQRQKFEYREDAKQTIELWARAYIQAINSNEQTCYIDLPIMPKEVINEDYMIIINSQEQDKINMQLIHNNIPVTAIKQIDTGFCMIIEHEDSEQKILQNFKINLIDNYNPDGCSNSICTMNLLNSNVAIYENNNDANSEENNDENKNNYETDDEVINQDETINEGGVLMRLPAEINKENSLNIIYQEENQIKNITTTTLSSNLPLRLIKINNEICIMPIDKRTNPTNYYTTRNKINYFEEDEFIHTTNYLGLMPKCDKTEEDLLAHSNEPIFIRLDSSHMYAQIIQYEQDEWITKPDQELIDSRSLFQKSILSSPIIIEYINNLLQGQTYTEGVKTLCDELKLNNNIEIRGTSDSGNLVQMNLNVMKLDGLRCELVTRTN